MLKLKISVFALFFCSTIAYSQTENINPGGRQSGMGYASVTLSDVWAVFNNPAGTAQLERINSGIYYENRFILKETGLSALAFSAPLGGTTINVGFANFGFSSFNKQKASLGFSQQLFNNFFLGINANYFSMRQSADYGNFHGMSFEIGALFIQGNNLRIATYIANPVNVSYFADNTFKLPFCLRIGLSYKFSNSLLFALETGKSINGFTHVFRSGIEYTINHKFMFRTGVAFYPIEYTFGLGYKISDFNLDFSYAYHNVLGSTPKISLNYAF